MKSTVLNTQLLTSAFLVSMIGPLAYAANNAGGGNVDCPSNTNLVAKFNTTNSGQYVLEGSNTGGVVISNATLSGGKWSSTVPILEIIVKGGSLGAVENAVNYATSGTFSNANLINGGGQIPGISNIKFCASKTSVPTGCKVNGQALHVVGKIQPLPVVGTSTTAVGTVTNYGTQAQQVGIASYSKFDEVINNQKLFDSETATVQPGQTMTMTVNLPPDCSAQIDLFCGGVIQNFTDSMRYDDRKMDYYHSLTSAGKAAYCPCIQDPNVIEITGIKIDGRREGSKFSIKSLEDGGACVWRGGYDSSKGTLVDIQAFVAKKVPQKVVFNVTGFHSSEDDVVIFNREWTEKQAPYYFLGDTNGQPNGWKVWQDSWNEGDAIATGDQAPDRINSNIYSVKVTAYASVNTCDVKTVDICLPNMLERFTATETPGSITVNWQPSSLSRYSGYVLWRADENNQLMSVSPMLINSPFTVVDTTVEAGKTYRYGIEGITFAGVSEHVDNAIIEVIAQ